MNMKTAFYWPAFLGPLGKQADFWGVANLLMESVTASDLELFVDTEPSRPALARLFGEIRRGHVHRIAKAIRLRKAGLTLMEIGSMVRATPSQVWRILSGFPNPGHCFRDDVTSGV